MLLGSYGMGIAWQTIGFQPFGTLAHPNIGSTERNVTTLAIECFLFCFTEIAQ